MSYSKFASESDTLNNLVLRMPDWDQSFLLLVMWVSGTVNVLQCVELGGTTGLGIWTTMIGAGVWCLWLVRPYYPARVVARPAAAGQLQPVCRPEPQLGRRRRQGPAEPVGFDRLHRIRAAGGTGVRAAACLRFHRPQSARWRFGHRRACLYDHLPCIRRRQRRVCGRSDVICRTPVRPVRGRRRRTATGPLAGRGLEGLRPRRLAGGAGVPEPVAAGHGRLPDPVPAGDVLPRRFQKHRAGVDDDRLRRRRPAWEHFLLPINVRPILRLRCEDRRGRRNDQRQRAHRDVADAARRPSRQGRLLRPGRRRRRPAHRPLLPGPRPPAQRFPPPLLRLRRRRPGVVVRLSHHGPLHDDRWSSSMHPAGPDRRRMSPPGSFPTDRPPRSPVAPGPDPGPAGDHHVDVHRQFDQLHLRDGPPGDADRRLPQQVALRRTIATPTQTAHGAGEPHVRVRLPNWEADYPP